MSVATVSFDLVNMDGRRIRFSRDDERVVVRALGTESSRTLDLPAARQMFHQMDNHGFAPASESDSATIASFFGESASSAAPELGHLVIVVRDLPAAIRFYQEALGLTLRERLPYRASFTNGGATVDLVAKDADPILGLAAQETLPVLHVRNLAAVTQRLAATRSPAGNNSGRTERSLLGARPIALCRDPEGHALLLSE